MSDLNSRERVEWPARAVVTAGMPYGNKPLHFGHIGGVFVPADAFARFLRDRIGAENVRFVSGTDCFGSPINEGYRKLVEAGEFSGTIADYVLANHERQKATLEAFQVSLDIYEGSGIGHAGDVHQMISDQFIERLHESGHLKLDSTLQFYDAKAGTFLNGRQVQGHCPVQGCKSEHAYADECDLGHQYAPVDLIAPVSTLTGTVPEMRPVENWYFDLPGFEDFLKGYVRELEADDEVRPVVTKAIAEFLAPPVIFVKNEHLEEYEAMAAELPPHEFRPAEGNKQSFEIEFASIGERDRARDALAAAGLRFRTSKTLVPFRITGNIEWGCECPAWRIRCIEPEVAVARLRGGGCRSEVAAAMLFVEWCGRDSAGWELCSGRGMRWLRLSRAFLLRGDASSGACLPCRTFFAQSLAFAGDCAILDRLSSQACDGQRQLSHMLGRPAPRVATGKGCG